MMQGAFHRLTSTAVAAAAVALGPTVGPDSAFGQVSTEGQDAPPAARPGATTPGAIVDDGKVDAKADAKSDGKTDVKTDGKVDGSADSDRREQSRASAEEALRAAAVPKPIDRARFTAFLAAIDKDLAASARLLEAHTAYFDGLTKQNESTARQILRLLPAAYAFEPARESYDPRPTPELVALLGLREKAARAIDTAERRLFDEVESALPADRKPRLALATLALRAEQLPSAALLTSTHASLVELVAQTRLSGESRSRLDDTLAAYARALAPALAERTALLRQSDAARAVTETAAGTLWRYAPAEIATATARQLVEIDDRDFASELGIRDIHFDTLARLRGRLEPRDGRRLVEAWQRLIHPELFDDERMLARIIGDTLTHPSFSDDHDAALLDLLETVYARLEPLSRKSCEYADLVLPRLATRTPQSIEVEITGRLGLIAAQHKRRDILKDCLQRIKGMLGDADPAMSARIEDALHTLSSLERADAFEERSLLARRGNLADSPPAEAVNGAAPASNPSPAGTPAAIPSTTPGTTPNATPDTTPDTTPSASTPSRGARGSRRQSNP